MLTDPQDLVWELNQPKASHLHNAVKLFVRARHLSVTQGPSVSWSHVVSYKAILSESPRGERLQRMTAG